MDSVRVFGLSRLDSLDLKSRFPDAAITFEPKATEDPQHGELATAALVAVTVAGIQALAAWLLMHRKNSRIEKTVEIVGPDGTRRTEKLVIEASECKSEADIVKALAKLFAVDLSKLT